MVYRVCVPFSPTYHPLFFSSLLELPGLCRAIFFYLIDGRKAQIHLKDVSIIKQITKEEMNVLLKKRILHNSSNGYVDRYGNLASYYRTCHRIYIGDKYADLARKLTK